MYQRKMVTRELSLLPVTITITILLFEIITPLISTVKAMEKRINIFSACAEEMIDDAFLGKEVNFTKCYLEKLNSNLEKAKCYYDNGLVICTYRNDTYVYKLNLSEKVSFEQNLK